MVEEFRIHENICHDYEQGRIFVSAFHLVFGIIKSNAILDIQRLKAEKLQKKSLLIGHFSTTLQTWMNSKTWNCSATFELLVKLGEGGGGASGRRSECNE